MESGQTTDIQGVSIPRTEAADDDVLGQDGQISPLVAATKPEVSEMSPRDEIHSHEQTPSASDHSDVKTEKEAGGQCKMELGDAFQLETKENNISVSDKSVTVCQSDSVKCAQKYEVLKGLLNKKGVVVSQDLRSDSPTDSQHATQVFSRQRQSARLKTDACQQARLSRKCTASKQIKIKKRKCLSKQNTPGNKDSRCNVSQQNGSALELLQMNTASMSSWALEVLEQAKSFLLQQQQKQQHDSSRIIADLPAEVCFAVEVLRSSHWQPPPRDSVDTDSQDAIDNIEDALDRGGDVGDVDEAVLLEISDGISHADAAQDCQTRAKTAKAITAKDIKDGLKKGTLVKFVCRLCKKVCSSRGVLKRHMIEKHSQRKSSLQFKCKLCGSVYKRKYCLVEHMRAHTGEKSVECTECDAKFRYRSDMRKHYRHKHGGKKYLCKVCGRYLKSDRGFKYHMSTHDETLPIVCDRCGRSFRCRLALKRHHEYTHKEEYESSVMCEMCAEMFPSGTALRRHQRAAKSGRCCSLRSSTNNAHSQGRTAIWCHSQRKTGCLHQRVPKTAFSVVNCQVCGEGFKSDQQLQMHMGYHTGTRPFLCSECNLAFSRKDHYNTHLRNHKLKTLMSKTFDCHLCGVGMKTEKHLEMHMGFHTGDRPYQCNVCWLAFAKKDRLDTHSQSHNADRVRFPCPTCGASFCTKALLKYHCVLQHNAETPHICKSCGERFDRKCHLQEHMKGPCSSLQVQTEQPSVQACMESVDNFQN